MLSQLDIHIPPTCAFFGIDRYYFINQVDRLGKFGIKLVNDFPKDALTKTFHEYQHANPRHEYPVAVKRMGFPDNPHITATVALSLKEYYKELANDISGASCLFQVYIPPRSGKPGVIRMSYAPQEGPSGFYITNYAEPDVVLRESDNYTKAFCVSTSDPTPPDSGPMLNLPNTVFHLRGKGAEASGAVAQKLFHFMQFFFKIKLESIVVDLAPGEHGQFFFLGIKSFKVAKSSLRQLSLAIEDGDAPPKSYGISGHDDEGLAGPRDKRIIVNYPKQTCYMCRRTFKAASLEKELTVRMMLECDHHMKKRGVDLFRIRNVNMKSLSNREKVCNLCWSMYVAEHELLQVEQTVAEVVGIPVKPRPRIGTTGIPDEDSSWPFKGVLESVPFPSRIPDPTWISTQWNDLLGLTNSTLVPPMLRQNENPETTYYRHRTAGGQAIVKRDELGSNAPIVALPAFMYEWRLMLLVQSMEDLPPYLVECSHSGILIIRFQILHKQFSIEFPPLEQDRMEFKRMFIYHLFTEIGEIDDFFEHENIEIWLVHKTYNEQTDTVDEETVGQGNFHLGRLDGQLDYQQPVFILIFNPHFGTTNMQMTLGLHRSALIPSRYVDLEPYRDGVYKSKVPHFNSRPLPMDWIETVLGGAEGNRAAHIGRNFIDRRLDPQEMLREARRLVKDRSCSQVNGAVLLSEIAEKIRKESIQRSRDVSARESQQQQQQSQHGAESQQQSQFGYIHDNDLPQFEKSVEITEVVIEDGRGAEESQVVPTFYLFVLPNIF